MQDAKLQIEHRHVSAHPKGSFERGISQIRASSQIKKSYPTILKPSSSKLLDSKVLHHDLLPVPK